MVDNKKKTLDYGKIQIYLDGFIENDYDSVWQGKPILIFLRTLYAKFLYKRGSVFNEKIILEDCQQLYEMIERFFNMYKTYRPIGSMNHFYY